MPEQVAQYGVQAVERFWTPATVVTVVRTLASAVLATLAAMWGDYTLLVVSLGVYWAGDVLDGFVARALKCETRIGAVTDIVADRFNAGAYYVGLAYLQPELAPAVFLFLVNFMFIDCFLSLAFLAWPIRSPNYFHVVDRKLWQWNWSKPGKAVNSGVFAIILMVTGSLWFGVVFSLFLIGVKVISMRRLLRIGLPVPSVHQAMRSTSAHPVEPLVPVVESVPVTGSP